MIDVQNLRTFAFVQHFLEFYAELLKMKRLIEANPDQGPGAPDSPAMDPELIVQRLETILETQAMMVAQRGSDFVLAQFREAQYVMAALADDIFLYGIEWRGRELWRENVLEYRLFKSRFAGERIFENIDAILRNQDRRQAELAPIYILALSLGFKGRYRGGTDRAVIEDYANRLFEFVFDRPADLHATGRLFIPSAYDHTLVGAPVRRPRLRVSWPKLMAAVVVAFLVVSEAAWLVMTDDIRHAADRVVEAATPDLP